MSINSIGLLSTLKAKLGWLSQRQKIVAENVANASTPGFKARDLKPIDFSKSGGALGADKAPSIGQVSLVATNHQHIAPQTGAISAPKGEISPDSETTMDGNAVVLEEEMLKMSESRMQFDAAIGFYQKSLDLMRLAAKAPGR